MTEELKFFEQTETTDPYKQSLINYLADRGYDPAPIMNPLSHQSCTIRDTNNNRNVFIEYSNQDEQKLGIYNQNVFHKQFNKYLRDFNIVDLRCPKIYELKRIDNYILLIQENIDGINLEYLNHGIDQALEKVYLVFDIFENADINRFNLPHDATYINQGLSYEEMHLRLLNSYYLKSPKHFINNFELVYENAKQVTDQSKLSKIEHSLGLGNARSRSFKIRNNRIYLMNTKKTSTYYPKFLDSINMYYDLAISSNSNVTASYFLDKLRKHKETQNDNQLFLSSFNPLLCYCIMRGISKINLCNTAEEKLRLIESNNRLIREVLI